jgi:hypothetical protein
MKYAMQQAQKADGRKRRNAQRKEIAQFCRDFRRTEGRDPTRTETAAHFHKSPAWLDYLLKREEQDA